MKNKKIPLRTCVVTKEKLEKKDLIRVVKNNENEVFVDLTGKANGRGAYIKKDIDVLNKARKSKVLDKHLETTIDDSVYEKLEEIINQSLGEECVALIVHGGTIMAILDKYSSPHEDFYNWQVKNGQGYFIEIDKNSWINNKKTHVIREIK